MLFYTAGVMKVCSAEIDNGILTNLNDNAFHARWVSPGLQFPEL